MYARRDKLVISNVRFAKGHISVIQRCTLIWRTSMPWIPMELHLQPPSQEEEVDQPREWMDRELIQRVIYIWNKMADMEKRSFVPLSTLMRFASVSLEKRLNIRAMPITTHLESQSWSSHIHSPQEHLKIQKTKTLTKTSTRNSVIRQQKWSRCAKSGESCSTAMRYLHSIWGICQPCSMNSFTRRC